MLLKIKVLDFPSFQYVFSVKSPFSPLTPKGEPPPAGCFKRRACGKISPLGVRGSVGIEFLTLNTYQKSFTFKEPLVTNCQKTGIRYCRRRGQVEHLVSAHFVSLAYLAQNGHLRCSTWLKPLNDPDVQ